MAGTIIKHVLMNMRAKTTVENTVMPLTIARRAMTKVVKGKEISLMEIETHFQVNLMYGDTNARWVSRTFLHYKLDLIPPTEHSVDSMSTEYPKSDKLLNDPGGKHAEIKLLEYLETEIKSFKGLNVKGDTQARSRNDKKSKMNLNIVINYSPCADCANEIEQFRRKRIEEDWQIEIRITFGTFYNFFPDNDTNNNVKGLAKLLNAGIQLHFVWDDDKFKKSIEQIGTKTERDARMKKDREYLKHLEEKAKEMAASKG